MSWLALDIGGANLKVADGRGYASACVFPLWKQLPQLASELRALIAEAPAADHLAVTMTGELADCFETRSEGVRRILEAVAEAAGGRHTRVYLVDGRLVSPAVAITHPLLAAASNWHALAAYAARFVQGRPAILLDIGSTTCDIVPIVGGCPAARGLDDMHRLLAGELVYTGVERSPVCAVVRELPYGSGECPVAQELFATTRDAYLILRGLPEAPNDHHTADGRPATRAAARARLARMLCADTDSFSDEDAWIAADAIAATQAEHIAKAMDRVAGAMQSPPELLVVSGHGEALVERVLSAFSAVLPVVSLSELIGTLVARCGPAHALATLARERSMPGHSSHS
jgi:probable H4MPT-linked C1 transfer pathway protein